jgi:thioredoxin-related protein
MSSIVKILRGTVLACALSGSTVPARAEAQPAGLPAGLAAYSTQYDAARDPEADLLLAQQAARQKHRHVLVMIGGDWCVWCFLLDRHLRMDAEAARLFYTGFEVLRVYYNDENRNQAFIDRFPEFHLFPHFFIVGSDGKVLASMDADVLIKDARFDTALFAQLVEKWTPRP